MLFLTSDIIDLVYGGTTEATSTDVVLVPVDDNASTPAPAETTIPSGPLTGLPVISMPFRR